jgi:hypothetical protein
MLFQIGHPKRAVLGNPPSLTIARPIIIKRQFQTDGKSIRTEQSLKSGMHEETPEGMTCTQYSQLNQQEKCMNRNINLE